MKRLLLTLSLLFGVVSSAHAGTFLQFTQINFNTPWTITESGGVSTTISTINTPVNVVFDPSFCLVVGCGGATNGTYDMNFTATSTSTAVNTAGVITQNYGGVLSFTQGTLNLLTVNFSDEVTGSAGGGGVTMNSSQPPDIFTGSSDVIDPAKLFVPRAFALSFSDWSPGLSITGTTISSAIGDATGTFNASEVEVIPEPASLILLGSGLLYTVRRLSKRNHAHR